MPKHTASNYDRIAAKYAQGQDEKPFTMYFERPGFASQLPDASGLQVLDAGCGPGWYSEFLASRGAEVTAVDFNTDFVRLTLERLGDDCRVFQADLTEPLACADGEFDLVIAPLVMHYIEDWTAALREFNRILKPQGVFVFSTHHPFTDWQQFETESYFDVELVEDEWDVGKVTFYRRPLTRISEDLQAAGFWIDRIHEPQPEKALLDVDKELFDRLSRSPLRLVVRAFKADVLR